MKNCSESYPNSDEIGSLDFCKQFVLTSLRLVLENIFTLTNKDLKVCYLIQLNGMYLHLSFIHLTRRVLCPNVFAVCSPSSTNRMTVLISINFYAMEDQILFIYNFFTCRIAYYLKAIYSCEFRYEVLDSH